MKPAGNIERGMSMERINKFLAQAGVCSRRDADRLVDQGRVMVNGQIATSGMKVSETDRVTVNGKLIKSSEEKILLVFNKPIGVTCTEKDKFADKKILDYVKTRARVTYAGRLDKESEGLMLLTNDGDLIQKLMKGANRHEKEYVVKVTKEITDEFLEQMRAGVYLKELDQTTRPCVVTKDGAYTFHIVLTQGLNRQIRRMCGELGYQVKSLRRIRIMNLTIGKLKSGESRVLTKEESAKLYELVGMPVPAQFQS